MLSPVLAGEKDFEDIKTHDESYFSQNNIIFKPGCLVSSIDRLNKSILLTNEKKSYAVEYDRLVICTGQSLLFCRCQVER